MIIATIVPNNYFAPWDFVKSMLQLSSKYQFYSIEGPSLPDNRNKAFGYAKKQGDDLLFIDSDIIFKPSDVNRIEDLLLSGFDAVTGIYVLGRPPYLPAIFKRIEGDYELVEPKTGLFPIGACGSGFLGISKRVIEKLENPFSNVWEGNIQHGEDISFCHVLQQNGFKLWCDSSINVGQIRIIHKYFEI